MPDFSRNVSLLIQRHGASMRHGFTPETCHEHSWIRSSCRLGRRRARGVVPDHAQCLRARACRRRHLVPGRRHRRRQLLELRLRLCAAASGLLRTGVRARVLPAATAGVLRATGVLRLWLLRPISAALLLSRLRPWPRSLVASLPRGLLPPRPPLIVVTIEAALLVLYARCAKTLRA